MNPSRTIFITGAAQGIGGATARLFASRGWCVGLADIDSQALHALAGELGAVATPYCMDVTRPGEWDAALSDFFGRHGRLDVLLNNAGVLVGGPFAQQPLAVHRRVLEVNLLGLMNGCHAAKPWLDRTPGARVINLSSIAALHGQPALASYGASKAAVRSFTEALNIEWRADGIRVLDVMPLYVRTSMLDGQAVPSLQRLGAHLTAQDVAAVVWQAALHSGSRRKLHWPVGARAHLLVHLAGLLPDRLNTWLYERVAG